jgi:glycosyltransferase involved in cell wall biosynthesis
VLEGALVAVVIPAFQEQRWIGGTVSSVPAFVDHVIVIDDASTDETAHAAIRAGDSRLILIRHDRNRGVGAAILSGYRRARALGADVVAVMAGDGQMHPDDLARVVSPVARGEADYVKGDRLRHPSVWRVMPLSRIAGTMALAWLTRRAAGLSALSDSQCGYTAISAEAIDAIASSHPWEGYGYPNDFIGTIARRGLTLREVEVRPVYRGEASGLRPWHLVTIGAIIARITWRRWMEGAGPLVTDCDGCGGAVRDARVVGIAGRDNPTRVA